ncbi:MAG: hypothetical protein IIT43_08465, partial [Clostridia bacterium]|nr:hypothetical protein [Clostridia bacterium]
IFAGKDRREVQLGRGGDAGSGPRGIGPDSMNLRRSLSVDHIVKFQFIEIWFGEIVNRVIIRTAILKRNFRKGE